MYLNETYHQTCKEDFPITFKVNIQGLFFLKARTRLRSYQTSIPDSLIIEPLYNYSFIHYSGSSFSASQNLDEPYKAVKLENLLCWHWYLLENYNSINHRGCFRGQGTRGCRLRVSP
jgi:hypothetical protein